MALSLRICLLLFLAGLLCDKTALAFLQDDLLHAETRDRLLLQASCGDTLGTVTADQVRQVGEMYLDSLLSAEIQEENEGILDSTANVLFRTAVHDFTVMKMCGSCRSLIRLFIDNNEDGSFSRSFPNYHFTYCAEDAYGWDSIHSSLVMLPLDPDTGELFTEVRLRTFMSLTQSRIDFDTAPTEVDLVGIMQSATGATPPSADKLLPFLTEYIDGMVRTYGVWSMDYEWMYIRLFL
jgi:hypothetical protein